MCDYTNLGCSTTLRTTATPQVLLWEFILHIRDLEFGLKSINISSRNKTTRTLQSMRNIHKNKSKVESLDNSKLFISTKQIC